MRAYLKQSSFFIAAYFCVLSLCGELPDREDISTQDAVVKMHDYPGINLAEFTLKNGMKIILKQTDDASDVCLRIAALGGYAASNHDECASGMLAANIVTEGGVGDLSGDKLSAFLYDHSIEFNLKIEPYARGIDATFPLESLDATLNLIKQVFISPQFNQESFKNILSKKKRELSAKKEKEETLAPILSLILDSENKHFFFKRSDLNRIDFNKTKQIFLASFSNPADFVCVIAGKMDIQKVKELCVDYLSSLSSTQIENKCLFPCHGKVSKKAVSTIQELPNHNECLVRLAFPLQIHLDYDKLEQLELICQILETRLRQVIKKFSEDTKGVDVWYELPLYPSLEHSWMTLQFYVSQNDVKEVNRLVLEELKNSCKHGFSTEEIQLATLLRKQSLQLWEHDNDYWIVFLSNHYLWGWDTQKIVEKFNNPVMSNSRELRATISSALRFEE